MARKSIAIVSRGFWPCVKGGAEKFMRRVAENLVEMGYRVTVYTLSACSSKKDLQTVRVDVPINMPVLTSYLFSRKAAALVAEAKPDAVLVNGYWGELAPFFLKKRDPRIPVLTVIHDLGLLSSPIARRQRLRHLLRMRALRKTTAASDKIIVPLESVAKDLLTHFNVDRGRVRVIGFEGVDAPMHRVHEKNEYFDIVQVARFAPNKGQHILLEATQKLIDSIPGLRVYLVGGVSSKDYLTTLRKKADKINKAAGKNIVTIHADVESVDPYYRLADVCVAASVAEEGYGLTVFECMGYGKPVVASSLFKEIGSVDETVAYIFKKGDASSLAETIHYVYSNYQEALRKANKALHRVKNMSWRKVAEIIVEEIEAVTAKP